MTLLDIGNTTAGVFKDGHVFSIDVNEFSWDEFSDCFYICVNENISSPKSERCLNLEPYFKLQTAYKGLGIDRIASCYFIQDGIIVDAGSAITIDAMQNGSHLGGLILPGLHAFMRSYATISPRLDVLLNTQIDLDVLPNNTKDAISHGAILAITSAINQFASGRVINLTGGDSSFLVRFLPTALVQQNLVFKGMLKLIKELDF